MENLACVLLGIVTVVWLMAILIGFIAAFPFGLIGFVALGGFALLFTKVIKDRMIKHAEETGADGIVCLRFTTSAVMQGSAELLAYGTAVKFKK